jgi:DNA-binding NtrC family response regulator
LRERREDIPRLIRHFAAKASRKLGSSANMLSPAFIEQATAYDWPGNIRELENLVERAIIMGGGEGFTAGELFAPQVRAIVTSVAAPMPNASLEQMERSHIQRVLDGTRWKIEGDDGAARVLGLNASTLRGRMRKLGIRKAS